MTTRTKPRPTLRSVPPETWGERMARGRKSAGVKLTRVGEAFDTLMSKSTINRLEQLEEVPTDKRDRQRAFTLVVAYGYMPSEFGLSEDDMPGFIDMDKVLDLHEQLISWFDQAAA